MDISAKARELADSCYYHAAYRGQRPLALHPFEEVAIGVLREWILAALRAVERETEKRVAERCVEIAAGYFIPGHSVAGHEFAAGLAQKILATVGAKP